MMEAMAEGMTLPPVATFSGYGGNVRGGGHDKSGGGWDWEYEGLWQGAQGREGEAHWTGGGGYWGGTVAGQDKASAAPARR